MTTKRTLVESYTAYKGWRCSNNDDKSVLCPYFLADSAYLVYEQHIKPLRLTHDLKMYAKKYIAAYREFTKDFFQAFDAEEQDYIVELMDALHDHIAHDIAILRQSVIDNIKELPLDVRQVLASLAACLHLTQCTCILYKHIFVASNGGPLLNRSLQGMITNIGCLFEAYSKQKANATRVYDLNNIAPVATASRILCNRIIQFVNNIRENG